MEYDSGIKVRILNDLMNFRQRKNDSTSGDQLHISNFTSLYPIIYFDLGAVESLTGDPKVLTLNYRLNEAANAQNYNEFS